MKTNIELVLDMNTVDLFAKLFGDKSNSEQITGNAVPVKLAEYVANCIRKFQADSEANKIIQTKQLAFHF